MRIPLLPAPYLDETFGSWFARAADRLRTEPRSLVNALLAEKGLKPARSFDLDTAPPEGLIESLTKRSPLNRSELERLIVPAGGSTLPPHCRNAYCPECLKSDREDGGAYIRRLWLDAWNFTCERHGSALGEFDPIEYRATETRSAKDLFPALPEAYRINPSVTSITLPVLAVSDGAHISRWMEALRQMLKHPLGRDLLVFVGSSDADGLYYELTGRARFWNGVWHDSGRASLRAPCVVHPLGPIRARISSAFVATYLWDHLFQHPGASTRHLAGLFEKDAERTDRALYSLRTRWPRKDRALFERALFTSSPANSEDHRTE